MYIHVRFKGLIFFSVAFSGIGTLLLAGERTPDSTCIILIEINELSTLTMKKDSPGA